MAYVLFALLVFAASVAVHILFCRGAAGEGLHAKAYVNIAVFFFGVYVAGIYLLHPLNVLDPCSFWGLPFKISSGLIYILLIPVYLSFYVLTQLVSPSKKILKCMTGKRGVSYAKILECVKAEDFINTRLSDLVTSGCVEHTRRGYVLSASGRKIALVLDVIQFVLGRRMGG
jgi:hypothetical protein